MSWVTLDDAAPLHRKQVAAGPIACWLWTCGLAYCDRQEAKDGFIPEAVVKVLYPGLGLKEANILVGVRLWERVPGGYVVHDYLEWREKRFNGGKSVRGRAGGSVSSEAKRQAALAREAARRLAQRATTTNHDEPTTTSDHNKSVGVVPPVVTTTTSPTDRAGSDHSGVSPFSFRTLTLTRARGARPEPPRDLMSVRIELNEYEPLPEHEAYAEELGLTEPEYAAALLDVLDRFGGKRHDRHWLHAKLGAFLEQAAEWKRQGPRRTAGGFETPAERRTREQLDRVQMLKQQEGGRA